MTTQNQSGNRPGTQTTNPTRQTPTQDDRKNPQGMHGKDDDGCGCGPSSKSAEHSTSEASSGQPKAQKKGASIEDERDDRDDNDRSTDFEKRNQPSHTGAGARPRN